ncbi:hypothetical protein OOJ91_25615 [Micromonospora lupini]|nr:hypothetical protein [Micromonospora lupini]MCX5069227.1 hypothetical protein [Micromonospora lupini]
MKSINPPAYQDRLHFMEIAVSRLLGHRDIKQPELINACQPVSD